MKKAWSILPDEWKPILKERGMRAFRADQILQALYRDYITDWDQATTLPKDFREQLKTEFPITKTKTLEVSKSSDGTQKLLIGLEVFAGTLFQELLDMFKQLRIFGASKQV